jgi:hypothetical protein
MAFELVGDVINIEMIATGGGIRSCHGYGSCR